jgi:indole-3-glycerol phosphate synthase
LEDTLGDGGDGDRVAVLAEIKRASPSKGDIDISAHAPSQGIYINMDNDFVGDFLS